jgi:carboxypeptidase D
LQNFDAVDAVNPDVPTDPAFFLNDPAVRKALHAPKKTWQMSTNYPWNSVDRGGDPSPESMTFLSDLARSASARGVQFVFFVGNDDAISPAFGTLGKSRFASIYVDHSAELNLLAASIQNTTFGDTRGFTKRPSTPWYADDGSFAGIIHAERNLTFAIMYGTGHQIAINQPAASFAFARDFIFGSNSSALQANLQAGRLADNPSLGQSALPAAAQVKYGQGTRTSMTTAPTKSVASFYSAIDVLVPTGTDGGGTAAGSGPTPSGKSGAGKMLAGTKGSSLVLGLALGISIMTGLC